MSRRPKAIHVALAIPAGGTSRCSSTSSMLTAEGGHRYRLLLSTVINRVTPIGKGRTIHVIQVSTSHHLHDGHSSSSTRRRNHRRGRHSKQQTQQQWLLHVLQCRARSLPPISACLAEPSWGSSERVLPVCMVHAGRQLPAAGSARW